MIKLFRSYGVHADNNILETCKSVLDIFDVKYTKWKLNNSIADHLEDQSLLAVKDVLKEYGVESAAIHKGNYSYGDFETPFICAIQQEDWPKSAFTMVNNCDGENIIYLDPMTNRFKKSSIEEFEKMDKEIFLLLDNNHKKDELSYTDNKRKERTENILFQIPIYGFGMVVLLSLSHQLAEMTGTYWVSPLFLITATIGLIISLLLVWHDVDSHDPFIKEVCGGSKHNKLNCSVVLNSKGAHFFGINWSVWGFAYFGTFFVCQIIFSNQIIYTGLWSLLSITTMVYVPYSIYYQAAVVKQWCRLCLVAQVIITVNALLGALFIYQNYSVLTVGLQPIFNILFLGMSLLLLTNFSVPILKKVRKMRNYDKRWRKLRFNPDIFQSLLEKSTPVTVLSSGLGIVIGNPDAKNEIIKVCNPYCRPCAIAHSELGDIVRNNKDVRVRIIFTASGDDEDIKTAPVKHLLAIQEKYGKFKVNEGLDVWYMSSNQDYGIFASKYPVIGELKLQKDKIVAMRKWCDDMKIRATPTIFINGKELPDHYTIKDLKNFF